MINVKVNNNSIILTAGKRQNTFLKNSVNLNGATLVVTMTVSDIRGVLLTVPHSKQAFLTRSHIKGALLTAGSYQHILRVC